MGALEARDDLKVRCLSRRPDELRPEVAPDTEVVGGDLQEPETLGPALRDADAAYYLVHSMGEGEDFEELDRRAAENFARAALEEDVGRIVYLGGLGAGDDLSRHLRSRQEVGRILRESGVPTLELRASVVIGAGSLSFEMIRALVERLPVMVLPRWVRRNAQPIAVDDVVSYLLGALEGEAPPSRVYQIGGADRVSYEGMMREYARQRGLRRLMVPVPVLTPWLSGLWLGLVTPVYARVGRKLASSLVHDTVVTDDAAEERFGVDPVGVRSAVATALEEEDRAFERVRWSRAARDDDGGREIPAELRANRYVDSRARRVPAPPERAFAAVRSIGPSTGGPLVRALWGVRRGLDRLVGGDGGGGPAHRPADAGALAPGDGIDVWRVERVEPPRLLRLRAEIRLPGRAWLQLEVDPVGDGARIRQTAIFDPRGLGGRAYWWALHPVHAFVFERTLRGLCREAAEG